MFRRDFIKISSAVGVSLLGSTNVFANTITFKKQFSEKLAIPPLAPYKMEKGVKIFDLEVKASKRAFLNGAKTSTYGVNGSFLGPTIRVKDEDKVKIKVKNSLDETTTMHWHGLRVQGSSDGGPHNIIEPHTNWSASLDISQKASSCWYHPHSVGKTGRQVFMGIGGLFLIDDKDTPSLDLPNNYGIDDIPLVIQDRRFDSKGEFLYKSGMMDTMMGVSGNVHLINGVIDPFVEVEPKAIRFRVLNASNARIYNLMFEKQNDFFQIASDSSLLPEPVKLSNFILAPGERAEMLVDFSKFAGKTLYFGDAIDKRYLLKVVVKNTKPVSFKIPEKLAVIDEYNNVKITKKRTFTLDVSMGWLGINEKQMDMNRIDESVKKDIFEIWEITNRSRMPHPFHVHGTGFKVLSRNGKAPLINETGLKDTVLVYGRETVQIVVKFAFLADKNNPYMYHCHILEHEDAGMMGQFIVES
jgi:FtsP/CotA-like multicopper oxidase with cupredoxin domain